MQQIEANVNDVNRKGEADPIKYIHYIHIYISIQLISVLPTIFHKPTEKAIQRTQNYKIRQNIEHNALY